MEVSGRAVCCACACASAVARKCRCRACVHPNSMMNERAAQFIIDERNATKRRGRRLW